jgi:hypothetical protein
VTAHAEGTGGVNGGLNDRQQGTFAVIDELDQQSEASHRQARTRGEFN